MLVATVLAFMLAAVVEFGFLMNNYIAVLNAAREAARFASNSVAISETGANIQEFYVTTSIRALSVLCPNAANCPIRLTGRNRDDIVISVLSISGASYARFPDSNGWSLCENHNDQLFFPPYHQTPVALQDQSAWENCTVRSSQLTPSRILSILDPNAPPSGVVLVEIFYNYPQVLGLPLLADFANPIPVYIYSAMPLSSAEPTATPSP
ncbi:MAG: pilus assembly protein [Anaerolineales bacterium]|nr:pilus assembly protein [Anaerolineales bacterium]MDW8226194.1 pilus assembly protein [Anaerolineales bacterium]